MAAPAPSSWRLPTVVVARIVEVAAALVAVAAAVIGLAVAASPLGLVFLVPGAVMAAIAAVLLLARRDAAAAHVAGIAVVPFLAAAVGNFPIPDARPGTALVLMVTPMVLLGIVVVMAWGAHERRRLAWGVEFGARLARTSTRMDVRRPHLRWAGVRTAPALTEAWDDVRR